MVEVGDPVRAGNEPGEGEVIYVGRDGRVVVRYEDGRQLRFMVDEVEKTD